MPDVKPMYGFTSERTSNEAARMSAVRRTERSGVCEDDMGLSERKKEILRAVVEQYVQTVEPVGSKTVAAELGSSVSSATIRSEMAELESLGLLEQPHTSAGRIPSSQDTAHMSTNS